MTRTRHQHQMFAEATVGRRVRLPRQALAADAMQGGSRVRPVGLKLTFASGLSLLSSPCRLGAGFGRRPFPNSSSAEVSSSVLSVIAQPSTARGGCLSSLTGGRQISSGGPDRGAFVAASVLRRFQASQHFKRQFSDAAEHPSCLSSSLSFDVPKHELRGPAYVQILSGEIQNV